MMNTQIIQYQIDLFTSPFNQTPAELDKYLCVNCLVIDHEANLSLIGDRKDPINHLLHSSTGPKREGELELIEDFAGNHNFQ